MPICRDNPSRSRIEAFNRHSPLTDFDGRSYMWPPICIPVDRSSNRRSFLSSFLPCAFSLSLFLFIQFYVDSSHVRTLLNIAKSKPKPLIWTRWMSGDLRALSLRSGLLAKTPAFRSASLLMRECLRGTERRRFAARDTVSRLSAETATTKTTITLMMTRSPGLHLSLCFSCVAVSSPPSSPLSLSLVHSHFSALRSFRNLDSTAGRDWTAEGIAGKERHENERDNRWARKGSRTKGSKDEGGCYRRISERTLARYGWR